MKPDRKEDNMFWAGGFLYDPKTESVLLHKRDGNTKMNPNKWAFFGGLSEEDGETSEETFVREMREELEVDLPVGSLKPLYDYLNEEAQTYRYVFYIESGLKKSDMVLHEGEDFDWIPLDQLFEYDLTDKARRDLQRFISQLKKRI
jgi:8-oxo-dGTP pyrophosphatase MutT (NUDIX family)